MWEEGNPFAWHLHFEAKLIHTSDGHDFLKEIGTPKSYTKPAEDCIKFYKLYKNSLPGIKKQTNIVFELSNIFLAIRNFATCYLLGKSIFNFSRKSALQIDYYPLEISDESFNTLERARIICTRGKGNTITPKEINHVYEELHIIDNWMNKLLREL